MKNLTHLGIVVFALTVPLAIQASEAKTGQGAGNSIRAKVGDRPQDVSHSIYTGTYGTKSGTFVLQWFNNQVRGAFFNSTNTQEVRLYGDNSVPGQVILEAWTDGNIVGAGRVIRAKSGGGLMWSGGIPITELVDIPITMHKYLPRGEEKITSQSHYTGTLGNTSVRVLLNWYANGKVRGRYTNLTTRKSYDLSGHNYATGKLYLDEWDASKGDVEGGQITARVSLRKVTANGSIHWQGRMFNMDGRSFAMDFTK